MLNYFFGFWSKMSNLNKRQVLLAPCCTMGHWVKRSKVRNLQTQTILNKVGMYKYLPYFRQCLRVHYCEWKSPFNNFGLKFCPKWPVFAYIQKVCSPWNLREMRKNKDSLVGYVLQNPNQPSFSILSYAIYILISTYTDSDSVKNATWKKKFYREREGYDSGFAKCIPRDDIIFFSQFPKRLPIFETNLEQCALKGAYKYWCGMRVMGYIYLLGFWGKVFHYHHIIFSHCIVCWSTFDVRQIDWV